MPTHLDSSAECAVLNGDVRAAARAIHSWRQHMPDIVKTVNRIIRHFKFDHGQKMRLSAAARLAAEPNNNAYHNNCHFLEVFLMSATLGRYAQGQGLARTNDLANLLTAALIHDYKHDGGANAGQQFRLETMAFDSAAPTLTDAGATPDDLADIQAYVLATDVSKNFADPNAVSPAESLKLYQQTGEARMVHPGLARLATRGLVEIASMLKDADLAPSLLSARNAERGGQCLAQEMGVPFARGSVSFFFNNICPKQLTSVAGRALLQPAKDKTIHDFEKPRATKLTARVPHG